MAQAQQPEIFNDTWQAGTLPDVGERQPVDYSNLAAMGSCFARNLNRWLNFHGYTEREMPWDILYNPFSIQKELERLYYPDVAEQAAHNVLHEVSSTGESRYRDPWRTWLVANSPDELSQANAAFDASTREFLASSNGMLITLGLTEVWSPAGHPDVVLNQVPIGSIRRGDTNWDHRLASVTEVNASLAATVKVIREHVTPDGPIIFTLSPVPLKLTASGLNIREANTRSKATLAVALGSLTLERSDVEYFPSYEMVQALAERKDGHTWQLDGRHVSAEVIDTVARAFLDAHGHPEGEDRSEMFWVPRVDANGKVVGRLYLDHSEE